MILLCEHPASAGCESAQSIPRSSLRRPGAPASCSRCERCLDTRFGCAASSTCVRLIGAPRLPWPRPWVSDGSGADTAGEKAGLVTHRLLGRFQLQHPQRPAATLTYRLGVGRRCNLSPQFLHLLQYARRGSNLFFYFSSRRCAVLIRSASNRRRPSYDLAQIRDSLYFARGHGFRLPGIGVEPVFESQPGASGGKCAARAQRAAGGKCAARTSSAARG